MTAAMTEMGVDIQATTIHSGLVPNRSGYGGGSWDFQFNHTNCLRADIVVVDECSMLPNDLMVSILSAIKPGTKVVLVGDPHQLPPIGKGLPFSDMIKSGVVPHARLTKIHRYAGRLAHACQQINDGKQVEFSKNLSTKEVAGPLGPENIVISKTTNDAQKHKELEKIIRFLIRKGYDIHQDIQVIVSRNDEGPVNRTDINDRIQWIVNPDVKKMDECKFGLFDKVMCKSNGMRDGYIMDKSSETNELQKTSVPIYVANGESGIVRHIEEEFVLVDFGRGPLVKFNRDAWLREKDLMLSYAITCHKAQGGGWPVIIYMIDTAQHVDRNLIYTAISRAKKMCFVIGSLRELNAGIREVKSRDRKTFVAEYLRELCK